MKQFYKFSFIGFLSVLVFFGSCNLINPAEPIPSYIHIERITLTTDECTEGSNSSKITDAWVYIDGNLVGCFELPVTFPVLADGSRQLLVKAGIKVNGISATRAPYPFYKEYTQTIELTRGEVTTVSPNVTYVPGLNWGSPTTIWMEDFDDAGMTLTHPSGGYDTTMRQLRVPTSSLPHPDIFEGICQTSTTFSGSGISFTNPTYSFNESVSSAQYVLPKGDSPVFLEFDYKCNYVFTVGLYEYSTSGTNHSSVLNFNPSDHWNKAYVYLSPNISASGSANLFRISFGMVNNIGMDSLGFAIDNIKLIHY